jgi:DNA topoisomerase IB
MELQDELAVTSVMDQSSSRPPTDGRCSESPDVSQIKLVYAATLEGGFIRRRSRNRFRYLRDDGTPVTDSGELARIAALAIPPAYDDVVISADPNSHLQAVGIDARGRKQYRYHPDWTAKRGQAKFDKLADFAATLPLLRERVDLDLRARTPTMEKAVATVILLLDRLFIRIGNAAYAQANKSYGLTTLRNRHVTVDGSSVHFKFKGKSGKEWRRTHRDRRIANAIRKLQELPGQHLFQYIAEDGSSQPISSQDVNAYIRAATAEDFTSRQFRTWGATCLAASSLALVQKAESAAERTRQINAVIDTVAAQLFNTRAVCRSSYIHPRVFEAFEDDSLKKLTEARKGGNAKQRLWMEDDEIRVLRWLQAACP